MSEWLKNLVIQMNASHNVRLYGCHLRQRGNTVICTLGRFSTLSGVFEWCLRGFTGCLRGFGSSNSNSLNHSGNENLRGRGWSKWYSCLARVLDGYNSHCINDWHIKE